MKVHIEEIDSYHLDRIIKYLEKVTEKENIWQKLPSKKILIKPNLLGPHSPDKAVTTHPVILEAIVKIFQARGFDIYLGDSPGGTVSMEKVWQVTGIKDLADKYGVKLLKFGNKGVFRAQRDGHDIILDQQVMDFPAIVNVAKYKTHSLTMYTGAIKNLFGVVPGLTKSDYHRHYPQPNKLAELIVKIYDELKDKVVLHVLDGIVGMEGEGPSSGEPKHFGLMFASTSATALDYTASRMLGYQAEKIPTVKLALENDNLKTDDIEVDEEWKHHVFKGTKVGKPSLVSAFINTLPPIFQKIFFRIYDYYPEFNDNCILCFICMKGCPVDAISFADKGSAKKKKKKRLIIDRDKCIKCLCCQEFCPHKAIKLKKTILAKLILR